MPKRIMVAGALAHHPLGGAGNAWAFLQYVLGFRRLGFDTYYVEHIDTDHCIDDDWQRTTFGASANARFFGDIVDQFGLAEHAALLEWQGGGYVGLTRADVERLADDTDLFVNLSGRFHLRSVLDAVRCRMYVDLDPGFVQIWQAQYGVDMNFRGHDVFVTVGLNLGAADCPMPTCGIEWHTTLPPVVLSEWAAATASGNESGSAHVSSVRPEEAPPPQGPSRRAAAVESTPPAYTTIADWRGYSPVEWNGVWYGQKLDEFLRIIELPRRVSVPLELCLAIHPDEPGRVQLEENGWRLVAPRTHAATADSYREYIRGSRGEFTVVKHGYAAGRTGWFSDRSACYLATGRPLITQDTGIGKYVPTGSGLLTFTDLDSAAAAIAQVEGNYARHADAAGAFARAHLDSDRVLTRLVELAAQARR